MSDPELNGDEIEDFDLPELLIHIEPDYERLDALGLSMDDFTHALTEALDRYHDTIDQLTDDDEIPDLEDAQVILNGQSHRLGDLAEVSIRGDMDLAEDEDDDEGESEE
jgi:hypothetical protein